MKLKKKKKHMKSKYEKTKKLGTLPKKKEAFCCSGSLDAEASLLVKTRG